MGVARIRLEDDQVHLFIAPIASDATPESIDRHLLVLSDEERARADRFHFEADRRAYVTSHALVRAALSQLEGVDASSFRFVENRYGRPEIVAPNGSRLKFNMSRTNGMTVCAVARERELGVDVEDTERPGETIGVADSFFARDEIAALRALPANRQRARFFEYWTLKESYIKARGMGLSLPLDRFAFTVEGDRAHIVIDQSLFDDASTWRFSLLRPTPRHLVALAVRGDARLVVHHDPSTFFR